MDEAKIPPGLQRFYIRTTQDPSSRFASMAFRQYLETLEPEQRARLSDKLQRARE